MWVVCRPTWSVCFSSTERCIGRVFGCQSLVTFLQITPMKYHIPRPRELLPGRPHVADSTPWCGNSNRIQCLEVREMAAKGRTINWVAGAGRLDVKTRQIRKRPSVAFNEIHLGCYLLCRTSPGSPCPAGEVRGPITKSINVIPCNWKSYQICPFGPSWESVEYLTPIAVCRPGWDQAEIGRYFCLMGLSQLESVLNLNYTGALHPRAQTYRHLF